MTDVGELVCGDVCVSMCLCTRNRRLPAAEAAAEASRQRKYAGTLDCTALHTAHCPGHLLQHVASPGTRCRQQRGENCARPASLLVVGAGLNTGK